MEQAGFIAVVEFGTSKITGIIARKNAQGIITILASETMPSDSCVKYGVIYNIELAAGKVKRLINLLENKIGKKIGSVYVAVAGKSLRAIEHTETKYLTDTPITVAILDAMDQQAKLNKPDFFTNYSVHEPQYYLDGVYEESPIGKIASAIESRSIIVIGPPNIKANLKKSVEEKAKIDIKSYITGPLAAGALVVSPEDRQAGCVLVDFGAGTTSLSIYKEGLLKFMTVIPFGGHTVTKDIAALGFSIDEAEEFKVKYGRLGKRSKDKEEVKTNKIDLRELNKVIQLRMDEIILNVIHQIKESGYSDNLEGGILTIGGASQLAGLNEYFEEKAQMPVKRATPKRVYINNASDILQDPAYSQVLGLLLFANENCELEEKEIPVVPVQEQEHVKEPQYTTTNTSNTSQHVQPEKDRRKHEEEHKKGEGKGKPRQGVLFGFIEKIQNFGGTMFEEEDEEEKDN